MKLSLITKSWPASRPAAGRAAVTEMVGLLVESNGPAAAVGDFCEIVTQSGRVIRTQVIGFRDGRVLSMPLEETDGLHMGDPIMARKEDARMEVGPNCWAVSSMVSASRWTAGPHRSQGTVRPVRRGARPAGTAKPSASR